MKRNIIRNLFPALVAALVVVSCQVDTVTESTVVTRLERMYTKLERMFASTSQEKLIS